jgi:hypothetical protein
LVGRSTGWEWWECCQHGVGYLVIYIRGRFWDQCSLSVISMICWSLSCHAYTYMLMTWWCSEKCTARCTPQQDLDNLQRWSEKLQLQFIIDNRKAMHMWIGNNEDIYRMISEANGNYDELLKINE